MEIDRGFLKIWHAWIKWMQDVPFWDPYGAAVSLVLCGFISGYMVWNIMNDN